MPQAAPTGWPPTTTAGPPPPRLVRSRSGGAENNSNPSNAGERFVSRSKSTRRSSRNIRNEQNVNPSASVLPSVQKKPCQGTSSSSGSSSNYSSATKRPNKSWSQPSAWALSPGRTSVLQPESPGNGGDQGVKVKASSSGSGGRVSSVLRYFRQKKVPSIHEEQYHRFKVLHNRLLQWRFANTRADAAMASVNKLAEDKLFYAWLCSFRMRNSIMQKRLQIQKLKHEIKLWEIINPQISVLNEWEKLEGRNCEAVSKVTRKLSALSVQLPLDDDAMGDVQSIHEAVSTAAGVMYNIGATISKFVSQVEKTLYLLTEFTSTLEYQTESLEGMEDVLTLVAKLLEWEKSAQAHLLQIVK